MREKIREFLITTELVSRSSAQELKDDTNLLEEGIIESFNVISLVVYLETTFNITVNSGDLAGSNFQSIEAIDAFVSKKKRERDDK